MPRMHFGASGKHWKMRFRLKNCRNNILKTGDEPDCLQFLMPDFSKQALAEKKSKTWSRLSGWQNCDPCCSRSLILHTNSLFTHSCLYPRHRLSWCNNQRAGQKPGLNMSVHKLVYSVIPVNIQCHNCHCYGLRTSSDTCLLSSWTCLVSSWNLAIIILKLGIVILNLAIVILNLFQDLDLFET